MFKKKSKSYISIELHDYVLRALVKKGPDFSEAKVYEVELPNGIVQEASIIDEMALFDILKTHVSRWGAKKLPVRFFVPDPSILLKSFEHPSDITKDTLKEYVQMELGHTIHLPFDEPLIDVFDPVEGDNQAMLFSASSEEVYKLMNLFLDAQLVPKVADIRALCNLRLLNHIGQLEENKTYLLANWSINELSICIYSNGNVDFLRYQPISTELPNWRGKQLAEDEVAFSYEGDLDNYRMLITDQVLELDRIMNFFRFSLHKGEKAVNEIVILGDNPIIKQINDFLVENLPVPIKLITDELINLHFPGFKAKHASLLGLALKGVN